MKSQSQFFPDQFYQGNPDSPANGCVSGLGTIVVDHQLFVPRYPERDMKVTASDHRRQIGGPVPTALAQLATLGHAGRFLGSWADDAGGQEIESDLREYGVQFDSAACRTSSTTGFAQIWVEQETGARTVVAVPPTGRPPEREAWSFGNSSSVLHLDGWGGDAAIAAAEATVAAGGLVTLDCGSLKPTTERLLQLATVVNAPFRFIQDYFGTDNPAEGARRLLSRGPRIVTITHGDQGAGIWTRDFSIWIAALPVPVVDTCGAGDVFCGGMLDGMLRNLEPLDILKTAMAASAWKVSHAGNREALANREQLESCFVQLPTISQL